MIGGLVFTKMIRKKQPFLQKSRNFPISAYEASQVLGGLPGWINELLKPGVGQGVFTTLKISLVLLILTLGSLLMYIEDETALLHMKIFMGMAFLLLILVVWFIGELARETKERETERAGGKED